MFIPYTHESVRLTGRWDVSDPKQAVATATGAYVEFAFRGRTAIARFDNDMNRYPLHLWLQLDGGPLFEAPIDYALRFSDPDSDETTLHVARVIYKGGTETSDRWYLPLRGKVTFLGVQLGDGSEPAPLPPDNRKTIEFIGDSITEGVLIDVDYHEGFRAPSYLDQLHRAYQDDVCATYAWLTARALDLRPYFMGYGAVGMTKSGCSDVPALPESYPYNYEGSPVTYPSCDYIMIMHGTNDRKAGVPLYLEKYDVALDLIRSRNPSSVVIVLSPFVGFAHEELGAFVAEYNRKNGCNVRFIDASGWIEPTPVHPLRDGHRTVAEHLVPILRDIISGSCAD